MTREDIGLSAAAAFRSETSRIGDEPLVASFIDGVTSANSSDERKWSSRNNPVAALPFEVRESLLTECYDAGEVSLGQRYFEGIAGREDSFWRLAGLMQGIFAYAIRRQKHRLAYNIVVVLSQLPYGCLGDWACLMAVAATRSPHLDVAELGVRCFENWESKTACEFLEGCSFDEAWLQEYAGEVCAYVMSAAVEEGDMRVLLEEDFAWQVAQRDGNSTGDAKGRASRHGSVGTQDREQQAFRLAG